MSIFMYFCVGILYSFNKIGFLKIYYLLNFRNQNMCDETFYLSNMAPQVQYFLLKTYKVYLYVVLTFLFHNDNYRNLTDSKNGVRAVPEYMGIK